MLIPVSASSVIVFVLGSNNPETARPSSAFKFFTVTSFVSPATLANLAASSRTCALPLVLDSAPSAAFRSPCWIACVTVGCGAASKPTTASVSIANPCFCRNSKSAYVFSARSSSLAIALRSSGVYWSSRYASYAVLPFFLRGLY